MENVLKNIEDQTKKNYSTFKDYYKQAGSIIDEDNTRSYQGIPGVLVWAKNKIIIGKSGGTGQSDPLPVSAMLMAKNGIKITGSFKVTGSMVCFDGDIDAPDTTLSFYPYFTKASLYTPTDSRGSLDSAFLLTDNLESGVNPCPVGLTMPRILTEGWEYYSENYYLENKN